MTKAKKQHDIMTADIANDFIQTNIDQSGEKVKLKIRGELLEILVENSRTICANYVIDERVRK